MIDGATAVQEAFYAALNVAAVTDVAPVWTHLPESTDTDPVVPPLVLIGDINLEPIGGKDGGLDRASVDVITIVRKPDRAQLSALQALVREQLDGKAIAATGAVLSPPFLQSAEGELLEDGETYLGTQIFETVVQAAD